MWSHSKWTINWLEAKFRSRDKLMRNSKFALCLYSVKDDCSLRRCLFQRPVYMNKYSFITFYKSCANLPPCPVWPVYLMKLHWSSKVVRVQSSKIRAALTWLWEHNVANKVCCRISYVIRTHCVSNNSRHESGIVSIIRLRESAYCLENSNISIV